MDAWGQSLLDSCAAASTPSMGWPASFELPCTLTCHYCSLRLGCGLKGSGYQLSVLLGRSDLPKSLLLELVLVQKGGSTSYAL